MGIQFTAPAQILDGNRPAKVLLFPQDRPNDIPKGKVATLFKFDAESNGEKSIWEVVAPSDLTGHVRETYLKVIRAQYARVEQTAYAQARKTMRDRFRSVYGG